MTADLIPFHDRRPVGRPSNAALQTEVRTLRAALDTVTEERDLLDLELSAWVTERVNAAAEMAADARRGRMLADAGRDPRPYLDRIATRAHREQVRARSARIPDDEPEMTA